MAGIITLINGAPHVHGPENQDPAQRLFTMDKDLTEHTFLIHLIAMPTSQGKPKVRMVWVATSGGPAVYEGQGSWSKCVYWVKRLPHIDISNSEWIRTRELFERNQYATLHEVRASLHDLESLGFQRADR
jgi:hypothetical protein